MLIWCKYRQLTQIQKKRIRIEIRNAKDIIIKIEYEKLCYRDYKHVIGI